MRKRERFILTALLLSGGLLGTQLVGTDIRPIAIALFFISSYLMTAWALRTSINGIEWLTIVPFPALYALSVSLFYFLLPSNVVSRILIVALFGIGMYALLLASNIFAFGKVRTIQLLRAAHAVASLFLFLLCLFFFNFIFSLRLPAYANALAVGGAVFFPVLAAIWSIELLPTLTKRVLFATMAFSVTMAEVALALSFLPIGLWTASLYLTVLVYVGFGLIQSHLIGRLFAETIREYLFLILLGTGALLVLIQWK